MLWVVIKGSHSFHNAVILNHWEQRDVTSDTHLLYAVILHHWEQRDVTNDTPLLHAWRDVTKERFATIPAERDEVRLEKSRKVSAHNPPHMRIQSSWMQFQFSWKQWFDPLWHNNIIVQIKSKIILIFLYYKGLASF